MGTDCAPLLANLYLFSFEYKFMKALLKNNNKPETAVQSLHLFSLGITWFFYISKAKHFSNTFRYIDDLLTINNPSFENEIGNIIIISIRVDT